MAKPTNLTKLTKRKVDALRFDESRPSDRQILYDAELRGFGVRAYPSGRKAYVIRYRFEGRDRLFTLKDCALPDTLDEVRNEAREALLAASHSRDPLAERKGQRLRPTLAEFADEYIQLHAQPNKRSWREDRRRLNTYILRKWGTRRVESITRAEVLGLHASIAHKHPIEANRVWALLSGVFRKAIEWGRVPADWRNPAYGAGTAIKKERSRERWITSDELPALMTAIEAEENAHHKAAFQLYLLTGLRRSELLSLRWRDVDFSQGTLHVSMTKSGKPHTLPLSAPAKAILAGLARVQDNEHVFPATRGDGHMSDLKKPWRRVRDAAGLSDVRLHDLRRTVGSMMAQDGASLLMIGTVLNHSESRTTERAYAHLGSDTVRDAMERHATRVIDIGTRRRAS